MAPKLHPEVFLMIFSYFQKADLKPLRLVDRMFNDLIIRFLFDKIYISPQYLNLTVFRNISQSPHLAKHVKELVYDATEFNNGIDEQGHDFSTASQADPNRQLVVPSIPSDTSYPSYQQLAMDQEELIRSEEDVAQLCTGLRLMPNITSVVVMDSWDIRSANRLLRGAAGPLSRTFKSLTRLPHPPWPSKNDQTPEARARSHRVFLVLIRALSNGKFKVHELKYHAEDERFCLPLHTFDLEQADLQHTLNVFQHLRKISLPLCTYRSRALRQSFFQVGNVARALSAAVHLEALELRFDTYGGRTLYPLALLFGEATTWPCLKCLVLSALQMDAEELMDFFYRHRATLKHVELLFVTIQGRDWEEVYNSMQDCLQLEGFGTDEPIYFVLTERGTLDLGDFVGDRAKSRDLAVSRAETLAWESQGVFVHTDHSD